MKQIFTAVIIFSLWNTVRTQSVVTNSVNDFQINSNNGSSTFIQEEPRIYSDGNSKIIVAWKDYRNGEAKYFAQEYSFDGTAIGDNFEIASNLDIEFGEDGTYVVLSEKISSPISIYFPLSYYNIYATFYDQENHQTNQIRIKGDYLPECGTGWTGIYHDIIFANDIYNFFFNFGGSTSLTKFTSQGDIVFDSESTMIDYAGNVSGVMNLDGTYILAWLNIFGFETPASVYANFYDAASSVVAENIPVFPEIQYTDTYYSEEENSIVKVTKIADNLYRVFFIDPISLELYTAKFDNAGDLVGESNSYSVYYVEEPGVMYKGITNCAYSNYVGGKFSILVSVKVRQEEFPKDRYFNTLFTFDNNGELSGEILTDDTQIFHLSDQFVKIDDEYFYATTSANGDVFLSKYRNFDVVTSLKANDDIVGSNDTSPQVTEIDNNRFFVSWTNEVQKFGRIIDASGNFLSDEIPVENTTFKFFGNGNCFNLWSKSDAENKYVGYSVFDDNWVLLKQDTLCVADLYKTIYAHCLRLNDENIILFTMNNGFTELRCIDQDGTIINERVIATDGQGSTGIFREDDSSFWVKLHWMTQLYSINLTPLEEEYPISPTLYLGDRQFLTYYTSYEAYPELYFTATITRGADSLISDFYIAPYSSYLRIEPLTSTKFIVYYQLENSFYARVFTTAGIPEREAFLITTEQSSAKSNCRFCLNNDKVCFVWSDLRNPENGFDIYCKIFDIDKITSVDEVNNSSLPKDFMLFQNYPNPFNPTTVIKYYLPEKCRVQVSVFNILGQNVAELVNGEMMAGTHEVEFGASMLPSGVYFYRLSTERFYDVKKMLLIK